MQEPEQYDLFEDYDANKFDEVNHESENTSITEEKDLLDEIFGDQCDAEKYEETLDDVEKDDIAYLKDPTLGEHSKDDKYLYCIVDKDDVYGDTSIENLSNYSRTRLIEQSGYVITEHSIYESKDSGLLFMPNFIKDSSAEFKCEKKKQVKLKLPKSVKDKTTAKDEKSSYYTYCLRMTGILKDGSKAEVLVRDIPVYFDINIGLDDPELHKDKIEHILRPKTFNLVIKYREETPPEEMEITTGAFKSFLTMQIFRRLNIDPVWKYSVNEKGLEMYELHFDSYEDRNTSLIEIQKTRYSDGRFKVKLCDDHMHKDYTFVHISNFHCNNRDFRVADDKNRRFRYNDDMITYFYTEIYTQLKFRPDIYRTAPDGVLLGFGKKLPATIEKVARVIDFIQNLRLTNIPIECTGDIQVRTINMSIVQAYPFREYTPCPVNYIRMKFNTLAERKQALALIKLNGYDTASDDTGHYYRLFARTHAIQLAGWNTIHNYEYARRPRKSLNLLKKINDLFNSSHKLEFESTCEHVFEVSYKDINSIPDLPKMMEQDKLLERDRLLVAAWDIETYSARKSGDVPMPQHQTDVVFMISISFFWKDSDKPLVSFNITDVPCYQDDRWITVMCNGQHAILKAFALIMHELAPDFIMGFNDSSYDWNFVASKMVQYKNLVWFHSKLSSTAPYTTTNEKEVYEFNYRKDMKIKVAADEYLDASFLRFDGCIPVDVRICYKKLYPKEETSGKSSLKAYLELVKIGGKIDLPIKTMWKYYSDMIDYMKERAYDDPCDALFDILVDLKNPGTNERQSGLNERKKKLHRLMDNMRHVAYYCYIDAARCQHLMTKRTVINDAREVSNRAYVSMEDSFYFANGMRVRNLTDAFNAKHNILMSMTVHESSETGQYPGAYVFDPIKGLTPKPDVIQRLDNFRNKIAELETMEEKTEYLNSIMEEVQTMMTGNYPITGLDFLSLYPSIIMAYNLSPDKYITEITIAISKKYYDLPVDTSDDDVIKRIVRGVTAANATATTTATTNTTNSINKQTRSSDDVLNVSSNESTESNESSESNVCNVCDDIVINKFNIHNVCFDYSGSQVAGKFIRHQNNDKNKGVYPLILQNLFDSRVEIKKILKELNNKKEIYDMTEEIIATSDKKMTILQALKIVKKRFKKESEAIDLVNFKITHGSTREETISILKGRKNKLSGNVKVINWFIEEATKNINNANVNNINNVNNDDTDNPDNVDNAVDVDVINDSVIENNLKTIYEEICFKSACVDSKQKAIKVYMNTFYGETGNKLSALFLLQLAGGVTTAGKYNIQAVAKFVKDLNYTLKYGDTDSLYLTCPSEYFIDSNRAYLLSQIPKEEYYSSLVIITMRTLNSHKSLVNAYLAEDNGTNRLVMAYEEVLYPCVMTGKKKYYGRPHENEVNFNSKIFIRGIEIIKQGQSGVSIFLGRTIMERTLDILNTQDIWEITEEVIRTAIAGGHKWNLDDCIKTYSWKPLKNNIPVKTFINRMKKYSADEMEKNVKLKQEGKPIKKLVYIMPEPGERFSVVVVKNHQHYDTHGLKITHRMGDLFEFPDVAKKFNLEIDYSYYLKCASGVCARFIAYEEQFQLKIDSPNYNSKNNEKDRDKYAIAQSRKYLAKLIEDLTSDGINYTKMGTEYKRIYKESIWRSKYNIIDAYGLPCAEVLHGYWFNFTFTDDIGANVSMYELLLKRMSCHYKESNLIQISDPALRTRYISRARDVMSKYIHLIMEIMSRYRLYMADVNLVMRKKFHDEHPEYGVCRDDMTNIVDEVMPLTKHEVMMLTEFYYSYCVLLMTVDFT